MGVWCFVTLHVAFSWMRGQRAADEVLLLPGTSPRQVNHSGSRVPPSRDRPGGQWLLDPLGDVQCRGRSPRRFYDHSRIQLACVFPASSRCLLWVTSHVTPSEPNAARPGTQPPHQGFDCIAPVYFGAAPVATSNSPFASK